MDTLAKVILVLVWLVGPSNSLQPEYARQQASANEVQAVRTFDLAGALHVHLQGGCVAVSVHTNAAAYSRPLWWTPVPEWPALVARPGLGYQRVRAPHAATTPDRAGCPSHHAADAAHPPTTETRS